MGFLNWLRGYLVISVDGKYPERFVNLCTLGGIYIKDAVKKDGILTLKTSKKAFRKMIKPAYKASCRVKIIKKAGLPFKLARLKKRKAFVLGAAFFIFVLMFLNSFVWTVRVDGNEKISEEEIKFLASYCGLRQGVVKYKVDEKKFSENALRCEPRLSWIWPEIKGTVCYIHVREKTSSSPPVDVKKPADVIAKRSGIIRDITVKRGWSAVKEGDSVTEGQILISSVKEGFTPVHALGEVLASYWVEEVDIASTKKEIVTYTGREKTYYSVVLGSFGMSFRFSGKAPYESFKEKREEKNIKLFGEIDLPLMLEKVCYMETVEEEKIIPMENAVNETKDRIIKGFSEKLPVGTEIENITVTTEYINEKEAYVKVIFECVEDIALLR